MPNPYYRSGDRLKTKNLLAGGTTVEFPRFALSKLHVTDVRSALDAGCGWGRFTVPLLELAPDAHVVGCDVWPGMATTCRATVIEAGLDADVIAADLRHLPFPDDHFDLAMANHMLYEFADSDVPVAIGELARVLRRGGKLLATTYAEGVDIPLRRFHLQALASLGFPQAPPLVSTFCLENGRAALHRWFGYVECHVVDERAATDDVDHFVEFYLQTGTYDHVVNDTAIAPDVRGRLPDVFRQLAQDCIDEAGAISTHTRWTAFVARSPRVNRVS